MGRFKGRKGGVFLRRLRRGFPSFQEELGTQIGLLRFFWDWRPRKLGEDLGIISKTRIGGQEEGQKVIRGRALKTFLFPREGIGHGFSQERKGSYSWGSFPQKVWGNYFGGGFPRGKKGYILD